MQHWEKKGLIFAPSGPLPWMHSHAQLPVVDFLEGSRVRVYYASRTQEPKSHIGYMELDLENPEEILHVSQTPVLEPGPIGYFDEHGVYPSSIFNMDGKKYLYYIGWNRGTPAPLFYASIGLAISEDGGKTFHRHSSVPILSRSEHDPCLVTAPFVYGTPGNLQMVYVSGFRWDDSGGSLKSFYHLKHATSQDGINWQREGHVAIGFATEDETNIARASIIQESGLYKMWFCYVRGKQPYRIGYAESADGKNWKRHDDEMRGLTVTQGAPDSDMMCYPLVVKYNETKYMFYNGNHFGQDGICLAIEKKA